MGKSPQIDKEEHVPIQILILWQVLRPFDSCILLGLAPMCPTTASCKGNWEGYIHASRHRLSFFGRKQIQSSYYLGADMQGIPHRNRDETSRALASHLGKFRST
jgi:hypothetical protein